MAQELGTWTRPRGQAWGNEAPRAVLHALCEDIVRRSGFRVAAIEVLRSDANLEFVAVAGNVVAREQLLGQGTPLALDLLVAHGDPIEGWVLIPAERLDDDARAWMAQYGHTPEIVESAHAGAWRAEDRLVRLLTNGDGDLRAILYLDEPVSGSRPDVESLAVVNGEIAVLFESVVSIVERELFGEQVRMVSQARSAMRSVPHGLRVGDFLRAMSEAMVETMQVDSVDVLLAGEPAPSLEPHTAFLEDHMHQVWLRSGYLVVEPTQTWGLTDVAVETPEVISRFMDGRGVASLLLVPIGTGEDYLGTMGLGRVAAGPRWIDSEINAAAAVAGEVSGVVLDARLQERERILGEELRAISDYRRDMVTTLAHELRNPVSVMCTHLDLLHLDTEPEAQQASLAAMGRAASRIEDMIEDLMALAKVSDPDRSVSPEPVDLSALVRETADFLAPMADNASHALVVDVVDGVCVVGEASGLQRMVTNLLSNAVKYTPPGGKVSLCLAPQTVAGQDGVELTCVDSGIGIDASEVGAVFTPFFRSMSREARQRPGTGLGLAITERVVKAHHGTVDVASELGVGTTFTVWLPLAPATDVR